MYIGKFKAVLVTAVLALLIGFVARDAGAAPVDNVEADGSTDWYVDLLSTAGAKLYFGSTAPYEDIESGSITGSLVHNGTFTGTGSSFSAYDTGVTINSHVYAQLILSNISGAFDTSSAPSDGTISLTFKVKIRFTGGVSCTTTTSGFVTVSATDYKAFDGFFNATSPNFAIPAFTATQCGGFGFNVDANFGLGGASAHFAFGTAKIDTPAILTGS